MTNEDLKIINQYQEIESPTETDIANLGSYLNNLISDEEFSLLKRSITRILEYHPELRDESQNRIKEIILTKLDIPINGKSCEMATAAAAAWIASIEAAWIGAMIACAATVAGYGICVGLATFAKYTALVAVFIDLGAACGHQQ